MANTRGPLFSLSARGTWKHALTFQHTRTGTRVTRKPRNLVPASPACNANMRGMLILNSIWTNLVAADPSAWTDPTLGGDGDPRRAFLAWNLRRWARGYIPVLEPIETPGPDPYPNNQPVANDWSGYPWISPDGGAGTLVYDLGILCRVPTGTPWPANPLAAAIAYEIDLPDDGGAGIIDYEPIPSAEYKAAGVYHDGRHHWDAIALPHTWP